MDYNHHELEEPTQMDLDDAVAVFRKSDIETETGG